MEITVKRGGLLTTVQDLGRRGHRSSGVPLSGAMDPFALRVANLLVGNAEDEAALECTLRGPELVFSADTVVAVTGAVFAGVPAWRKCASPWTTHSRRCSRSFLSSGTCGSAPRGGSR